MAAQPPEGFSPWAHDLAAARGYSGAEPDDAHEFRSLNRRGASRPAATPWLWLPLALSSMLLVLFVVVVNREQAQAQRLSELLSRVEALEHSRALERTAVLEQQLRSMLNRLQELEKRQQAQEQLASQLQGLHQELQQLRNSPRAVMPPFTESPAAADAPPRTPKSAPRPATP